MGDQITIPAPRTLPKAKQKKVHYERGTKERKSSHGHRSFSHRSSSRDSGVGSSTESGRVSLGTTSERFTAISVITEGLPVNNRVIMEVPDAAHERIRQVEAANTQLNAQLADSNKENRALKRERIELLEKVNFLMDDLENEKKKNQKPNSRQNATASTGPQRGSGPPRSQGSHREKRESWREMPTPLFDRQPTAPRPPMNTAPNPFMPNASRPPSATVTYGTAYASSASYITGPVMPNHSPSVASGGYPISPPRSEEADQTYSSTDPASSPIPDSDIRDADGRYHPYPI